MDVMSRAERIVEERLGWIEEMLQVEGRVEVLEEVKPEHRLGSKPRFIEGIFSEKDEQITLYPLNIWYNHCGLLPEAASGEIFEGEIIGVLAHELKHLWQHRKGLLKDDVFEEESIEAEAHAFGHRVKCLFYGGKERVEI